MASVLKLVAKDDDAIVMFSFNETTGTENPNSLKTFLLHDPDFGTIPSNFQFFESEDSPGGTLAKRRHGLTEMRFRFRPLATSADNLYAAIGTLGKYLDDPSQYALYIQLDGWAERRYADVVGGLVPSLLRGQELALFQTLKRFEDPDGVEVVLWRQPYLRGPSTTVGPTTVPNDPADANGRYIEVTNNGNAAAPAAVKVQGDTGAKVQSVVIARKSAGPYANTRVSDYTGGTQYGQLNASLNSWTVTLTNDTTSVADTDASGGNTAQSTHSTNPTVMNKRVRITRTIFLDSLRGTFDVYARVKNTAAAKHTVQLRWAHSLADPATFSEAEVIHDTTGLATFAYVDVKLGRISVPQGHTLGGLALEFWSRRDSGSGNLRWDFLSLVPADESLSTIVVPWNAPEIWLGSQLATPVTDPSGGTAGTVSGTELLIDSNSDTCGEPPAGGRVLPAGRHRWTFKVRPVGDGDIICAIRDIGAPGSNLVSGSLDYSIDPDTPTRNELTLEADTTAGLDYQAQMLDMGGGNVYVQSITHEFLPYIAANQEAHSDPTPGAQLLHKMDSSDNILHPLSLDGPLPIWLQPGLNCLYIHYADAPVTSGSPGPQSVLTRDCSVSVNFAPRYLL